MFRAVAATAPQPPSGDELEFKAERFHAFAVEQLSKRGWHHPRFHANPMVSPPPLRDDGITRCDNCRLNMAEYLELPENARVELRAFVLAAWNADEAWRNK